MIANLWRPIKDYCSFFFTHVKREFAQLKKLAIYVSPSGDRVSEAGEKLHPTSRFVAFGRHGICLFYEQEDGR